MFTFIFLQQLIFEEGLIQFQFILSTIDIIENKIESNRLN